VNERLPEIVDQLIDGLDADGEPHRVLGDAEHRAPLGRQVEQYS
jgi:hypothetical protein